MSVKQYSALPLLSLAAFFCSLLSVNALAETWSFDPSMLSGEGRNIDISVFNAGSQLPGTYPVDILLNGDSVDFRDMVFRQQQDQNGKPYLKTCLTKAQLIRYGVKTDEYPGLFQPAQGTNDSETEQCATLAAIPHAKETYQFYRQQLLLSIPQAALQPKITGLAPQALWDDGIPALLMNYRINSVRSEDPGSGMPASTALYAQLTPGANLGPWRLRNLTTWQKKAHSPGKWQTPYTYLERGLYDQKSRLTLGDRYTPADTFDSVPFRGVMLGSDEAMVPYNQREFAPVVRGIARTQAHIEVKRSGYVIYRTTVAPGPFVLTDLPPASGSGELQVAVLESNGQQQNFVIPSATPAIALREGYVKYNLMAGRYRPSESATRNSNLVQASMMYGLPKGITAYGGLQRAEHYRALSLGVGISLNALGALSLDGIREQGKKRGEKSSQGQRWRVRYSKNVTATNTGLTLSGNRYASSGFSGLSGVLNSYQAGEYSAPNNYQQKSRTTLTLSQSLGVLGSVSLTGARERYWRRQATQNEFMISWGTSFRDISWSLNWAQYQKLINRSSTQRAKRKTNREMSFWLNMPLERWVGNQTRATYQVLSGGSRETQHETGLSGDSFAHRLSWDVRKQVTPSASFTGNNSSLLNLGWRGSYGELQGSYSQSPSSRQINTGIAGGLLLHRHGVTLGQPLGQTMVLVEAPGAPGVSAGDLPGVKTDFRGYTTLDFVTPYKANVVTLDPATLPADVDVPHTDTRVIPTAGAVISAKFAPRTGARAVITLIQTNNQPVPFGALVTVTGEKTSNTDAGITGDDGEVYMSGLPQQGKLQVSLEAARSCIAPYRLPKEKGAAGIYALSAICS